MNINGSAVVGFTIEERPHCDKR